MSSLPPTYSATEALRDENASLRDALRLALDAFEEIRRDIPAAFRAHQMAAEIRPIILSALADGARWH